MHTHAPDGMWKHTTSDRSSRNGEGGVIVRSRLLRRHAHEQSATPRLAFQEPGQRNAIATTLKMLKPATRGVKNLLTGPPGIRSERR